ncbi:cupin-like domain-containing protein [Variovorax sp. OV329]|uniref:cupin-like domain-containing protein n=1 Tax=Variovorax sp. OV329 TaxID=1882825 RepID=UPI0008EA4A57|nr:cupin-like domain-containing protein [Variovorax sp. OV329]SFN18822.1 Cupin-like domain-containing protein [Variovorax sp. OV329]
MSSADGSGRVAAAWIELERVAASSLSYEAYLQRYVRAGRPVVITGVAPEWAAMRKWTPQYFKERFGSKPVAVSYTESMPFDAFIDAVVGSSDARPGPYMFRSFLHEILPELLPDVIPQNKYAFPGRHASPLMPEKWHRPDGYLKLLIGGVGSKFPVMHYDGENSHAFITQIYGEKEFVVFAPADGAYLYPGEFANQSEVDNPIQQDRERFPLLEKATPYRAMLGPGDMVFVPCKWWHSARAASTSISVCTNMLDRSNWDGFVAEVSGSRRKTPLRLRLHAANAVMSVCEWLQDRAPGVAKALVLPRLMSPTSAEAAPEPSARQLNIRIPTA